MRHDAVDTKPLRRRRIGAHRGVVYILRRKPDQTSQPLLGRDRRDLGGEPTAGIDKERRSRADHLDAEMPGRDPGVGRCECALVAADPVEPVFRNIAEIAETTPKLLNHRYRGVDQTRHRDQTGAIDDLSSSCRNRIASLSDRDDPATIDDDASGGEHSSRPIDGEYPVKVVDDDHCAALSNKATATW
jgi:hypothetical protein